MIFLEFMVTPYSMNRLFSEFFREFSGVILEVCETIWGSVWRCFGRILKDTCQNKLFGKQEIMQTACVYHSIIAVNSVVLLLFAPIQDGPPGAAPLFEFLIQLFNTETGSGGPGLKKPKSNTTNGTKNANKYTLIL